MQYQDETYMGNQDYPADRFSTARQRYEENFVPVHDHSSQTKLNIALAVGALAVAGGLTYLLSRQQGSKSYLGQPSDGGVWASNSVTIMKAPEELYSYWRKLENLPRIMSHLESVEETSSTRSHWVAKAPLGTKIAWDAEITEDIPNEKIAWCSLPNSQVPNEGYVEFSGAGEGRGTMVHVSLTYHPPGGAIGAGIAKVFGKEPGQEIAKDMRKFQQVMEVGEHVVA
jgi:uncharacterized membrane protein